eukprot:Nitzschia sp. Nitz4//scaffold26_size159584//142269//142700//NITZ4_002517-RA/size159584-processed-gene-0.211-mRNA-1//1//CDS//3329545160//6324//frame0
MATPSEGVETLTNVKKAIRSIKKNLALVVQRLKDDEFGKDTAQAQATVALSLGMLKYMSARLQGLDRGRKPDDPLRKELNHLRKTLAEIKAQKSTESNKSSISPPKKKMEATETATSTPNEQSKTHRLETADQDTPTPKKRKL